MHVIIHVIMHVIIHVNMHVIRITNRTCGSRSTAGRYRHFDAISRNFLHRAVHAALYALQRVSILVPVPVDC